MKTFTIIKTGYSAGTYGCSNEYFTLIATDDQGEGTSINFHGLYGTDYRVAEPLKAKGYKQVHASAPYGQIKGEERTRANKYGKSEFEAIEYINTNL